MIEINDYKPLALKDKNLFAEHYKKYPQDHSEYTFTGLVAWSDYMQPYYFFRNENLYLMNMRDGKPQFRLPIGEPTDSEIKDVLEIARKKGGERPIIAVTDQQIKPIQRCCPNVKINEDRNFWDYVYLSKDLAELEGKHYQSNRNHIRQFNKKFNHTVEPLSSENLGDAKKFLDRWCLWRECEKQTMLAEERKAILYCMKNYAELGLSGTAIRINGQIQAISVFEELNKETAVVHFEKAMPDYEGLYQTINNESAKTLAPKYKYINRESDLGIPGLRTTKTRLNPDHMEKLYYINHGDLSLKD